ncbi:MAG: DUF3761 domain-containing protein [bacterium]|nr:DUF3761 domain-containing protein [bacterium]
MKKFLMRLFLVVVFSMPVWPIVDYLFVENCENESIILTDATEIKAGEKDTTNRDEDGKIYRELVKDGKSGESRVCRRGSSKISETIIEKAEPPVYNVYTYRYKSPVSPPSSSGLYYSGQFEDEPTAICADGTYSYSTGRGTCSGHGGVDEWL